MKKTPDDAEAALSGLKAAGFTVDEIAEKLIFIKPARQKGEHK